MKKYFIFQFACFGDCLYATTVARQIKHDEPGSHVTWAIASKYKSVLLENPDVDTILTLDIDPRHATAEEFTRMEERIDRIAASGEYDQVYHLQVLSRRHLPRFCTTLRRTVFQIFGRPISVDISPVVHLTAEEAERVRSFAEMHRLSDFRHVILFECAPASGQSIVNTELAIEVGREITAVKPDVCFILSSPQKIEEKRAQIIDASSLSFRENAALTFYCTLLIGCSSGITWLSTSTAAKKLPMVQLLSRSSEIFAGVSFDFVVNGIDNDHILEMVDFDGRKIVACILTVIDSGMMSARPTFHQVYRPGLQDMENNLRRLVWLNCTIFELLEYTKRFVMENRLCGNPVPIGEGARIRSVVKAVARRTRYRIKAGVKAVVSSLVSPKDARIA